METIPKSLLAASACFRWQVKDKMGLSECLVRSEPCEELGEPLLSTQVLKSL